MRNIRRSATSFRDLNTVSLRVAAIALAAVGSVSGCGAESQNGPSVAEDSGAHVSTFDAAGADSQGDAGHATADTGEPSADARTATDTGTSTPMPEAGSDTAPPATRDASAGDASPRPDASTASDAPVKVDADAASPRSDASTASDAPVKVDAGDAGPGGDGSTPIAADLVGWATVAGMGLTTTTGGAGGSSVTVKTLSELIDAAKGTTQQIIQVSGHIKGNVSIGSNKTLIGMSGAIIEGHMEMSGSANVILKNLKVVGYSCSDNADCQSGADAVTLVHGTHHVWIDHCDISDGSDGNLDMTHAVDFVTVSWTKFSYSGVRAGGHQLSNLIGHTDDNPEDVGHLRITFHHDWWAANVDQRMPRVRYGQVHLFDNLYTATGNSYCIHAGVQASILSENNAFVGVKTPFDLAEGDLLTRGDIFQSTTGNQLGTGKAFTPPYPYALAPATAVEAAVKAGAGVK